MTWHFLEFEMFGDGLKSDRALPAWVDDAFMKDLIGDHPNLKYDIFPLGERALSLLALSFSVDVDEGESEYFIEYRFPD